jgi:hypothetical protein
MGANACIQKLFEDKDKNFEMRCKSLFLFNVLLIGSTINLISLRAVVLYKENYSVPEKLENTSS